MKRNVYLFVLLVLALALTACGGGSTSSVGEGGSVVTVSGTLPVSAFGASVIVVDETGAAVTGWVASGSPPKFSYTIPVGYKYRFFFVTGAGTVLQTYCLLYETTTTVFNFQQAITINLGLITLDFNTGRATAANGFLAQAGVTSAGTITTVPPFVSGAITWTKTLGGTYTDRGYSVQQTTDGGYIIAGHTDSFGAGNSDVYLIKTDAFGNAVWTKTFGGTAAEFGSSVQQTSDGGYIIAGTTGSFGAGSGDVYLIKTDASGNAVWTKTFGGTSSDTGSSVQQTSDGGYIITGGTGGYLYLIKTDASGNIVWTKTGGTAGEFGRSVRQTSDGGYVIAGYKVSSGATLTDVYLMKTDASGNTVWTKTFGGTWDDEGYSVQQTTDGGYIISVGAGSGAAVDLIKTDASGNAVWTKTFGGTAGESGHSVQHTSDGGYIIAGYTGSFGAGNGDVYLIKTDASGNAVWTKTFGGTRADEGHSVQQTSDGGYIIAGDTSSFGPGTNDVYLIKTDANGNVVGLPSGVSVSIIPTTASLVVGGTQQFTATVTGSADTLVAWSVQEGSAGGTITNGGLYIAPSTPGTYHVVATSNADGTKSAILAVTVTGAPAISVWTKTLGGTGNDWANSVQQTSDGGYIVAGGTASFGAGSGDVYLIKTDASGNAVWTKTFGGTGNDWANSVQQTSDGGYVIVGTTPSDNVLSISVYLIKTDAFGNAVWTKTFGGTAAEFGNSVQQTMDGGYIIAGHTGLFGAGGFDVYLIKTESSGNVTWTKTFGGTGNDWANSVQQTTDGGYIVAGGTDSFGAGGRDVYLIKTDSSGNATWTKTFGGPGHDVGVSVQQTSDGGYIVAGATTTLVGGEFDVYLTKTDTLGNVIWTKTFGGTGYDSANSVQQTSDGGYIVAGVTDSFGAGGRDMYLIKADSSGNAIWTKTFGGTGTDLASSVQQTSDGGYIVAGGTDSFGAGASDVYLIKTDSNGNVP